MKQYQHHRYFGAIQFKIHNNNSQFHPPSYLAENLVMKKTAIALLFAFTSVSGITQDYCDTPIRIFTNGDFTYNYIANGTDINPTPPMYGCLDEIYTPIWFTFFACDKGTVEWEVSASDSLGVFQDLDYIIWGPFTSDTACVISAADIIDCDFTGLTTNTINSGSVTSLFWYKILISNYDQSDCQLLFHITSGQTVSDSSCIAMSVDDSEAILVSVYPNPASDQVQLQWNSNGKTALLQITALTGQMVHQEQISTGGKIVLTTSEWANGSYIVSVNQGEKIFHGRILIAR